jgi:hypothetical protein
MLSLTLFCCVHTAVNDADFSVFSVVDSGVDVDDNVAYAIADVVMLCFLHFLFVLSAHLFHT